MKQLLSILAVLLLAACDRDADVRNPPLIDENQVRPERLTENLPFETNITNDAHVDLAE